MKDDNPFDQLSPAEQRSAIDVACAVTLIITRLPNLPEEWADAVIKEFELYHTLPPNLSKFALRRIGKQLFQSGWRWNVTKETDGTISTYFKQGDPVIIADKDPQG